MNIFGKFGLGLFAAFSFGCAFLFVKDFAVSGTHQRSKVLQKEIKLRSELQEAVKAENWKSAEQIFESIRGLRPRAVGSWDRMEFGLAEARHDQARMRSLAIKLIKDMPDSSTDSSSNGIRVLAMKEFYARSKTDRVLDICRKYYNAYSRQRMAKHRHPHRIEAPSSLSRCMADIISEDLLDKSPAVESFDTIQEDFEFARRMGSGDPYVSLRLGLVLANYSRSSMPTAMISRNRTEARRLYFAAMLAAQKEGIDLAQFYQKGTDFGMQNWEAKTRFESGNWSK